MNEIQDSIRVSIEFMLTELETGFTFASLALRADPKETEKRRIYIANARKAYDTALHFLQKISFTQEEMIKIQAALERLKGALQTLGESL